MAEKYRKTNVDRNKESIVSVHKWEEVKKVEEVEDCFILEFDPTEFANVGRNEKDDNDDDSDGNVKISGSIVCAKKREDVKKIEEFEDCFILEFDPSEEDSCTNNIGFRFSKMSVSVKTEIFSANDDDDHNDDVSILFVKGQVACRDYPHPRHLCGVHPFKNTSHETHCKMCYCYVCDSSAPCQKWTKGCKDPSLKHCDATPNVLWKIQRDLQKLQSKG